MGIFQNWGSKVSYNCLTGTHLGQSLRHPTETSHEPRELTHGHLQFPVVSLPVTKRNRRGRFSKCILPDTACPKQCNFFKWQGEIFIRKFAILYQVQIQCTFKIFSTSRFRPSAGLRSHTWPGGKSHFGECNSNPSLAS